jgi:hypothetical protein
MYKQYNTKKEKRKKNSVIKKCSTKNITLGYKTPTQNTAVHLLGCQDQPVLGFLHDDLLQLCIQGM